MCTENIRQCLAYSYSHLIFSSSFLAFLWSQSLPKLSVHPHPLRKMKPRWNRCRKFDLALTLVCSLHFFHFHSCIVSTVQTSVAKVNIAGKLTRLRLLWWNDKYLFGGTDNPWAPWLWAVGPGKALGEVGGHLERES